MARSKSGGVRLRSAPKMEEQRVRGRRAGVQGTYGAPRGGGKINAERTIMYGHGNSDGGGEGLLGGTARNLYRKALSNAQKAKRDKLGDGALWER